MITLLLIYISQKMLKKVMKISHRINWYREFSQNEYVM